MRRAGAGPTRLAGTYKQQQAPSGPAPTTPTRRSGRAIVAGAGGRCLMPGVGVRAWWWQQRSGRAGGGRAREVRVHPREEAVRRSKRGGCAAAATGFAAPSSSSSLASLALDACIQEKRNRREKRRRRVVGLVQVMPTTALSSAERHAALVADSSATVHAACLLAPLPDTSVGMKRGRGKLLSSTVSGPAPRGARKTKQSSDYQQKNHMLQHDGISCVAPAAAGGPAASARRAPPR